MTEFTGTVRGTRSGIYFLSPDGGGEDLMIAPDGLHGALHGDHVRASLVRFGVDYRPRAIVEEILERTVVAYTGNVQRLGGSWIVRPDSPLLPEALPLRTAAETPVSGSKVVFRVETKPGRAVETVAVYHRMIGEADDARLDPIVVAMEFGLATRFSDAALEEADRAVRAPDPAVDRGREDFRSQFVLTIDPIDAKDFDDAIALTQRDDGGFELAVHIADVTAYVPEGGALDLEARARGTSVYFPGTVFPMLPEQISNEAASLSPGEEKRVFSVLASYDRHGQLQRARCARGWMVSRARLHYAQAQRMFEGTESAQPEVVETLRHMHELAALLRARRVRDGAFDLDLPEVEMRLGRDGVPTELYLHETHDSNRWIEEFMIAANLVVGAEGKRRGIPILYRVHGEPDVDRIEDFLDTLLTLLPGTRATEVDTIPKIRRFLAALPPGPKTRVIHRFFLRSMMKARYALDDIGHFGLAVSGYSHFTSPIRRYPDLWTHRRLGEAIAGARSGEAIRETTPLVADSTSAAERQAEDAEREISRLLSVRFAGRHLGEEEDGHVVGLTPRGLFVELAAFPLEGFVAREELPPGVRFVEERMAWVESRGGWELRPGEPVRVQIVRADLRLRQVTFALVAVPRPGPRGKSGGGRGRARHEIRRGAGPRKAQAASGRPGKRHPAKRAPKAGPKRGKGTGGGRKGRPGRKKR